MYFVLKILKILFTLFKLYMFWTPLCPSSGASQLHMQSLVPCGAWFVGLEWRTQRTKHHTGPKTACAAEKLLMLDTVVSETCRAEIM